MGFVMRMRWGRLFETQLGKVLAALLLTSAFSFAGVAPALAEIPANPGFCEVDPQINELGAKAPIPVGATQYAKIDSPLPVGCHDNVEVGFGPGQAAIQVNLLSDKRAAGF